MSILEVVLSIDGKVISDPLKLPEYRGLEKRVGGCVSERTRGSQEGNLLTEEVDEKANEYLPDLAHSFQDIHKIDELSLIFLPIIIGGNTASTITGVPGSFLNIPIDFVLFSKKVKKNICYVRYHRKSSSL